MFHQLGQKGHKRISNKLPIIGISAVIIILIGLLFMSSEKYRYRISNEDMLSEVLNREDVIRPEKLMEILYTKDSLYRFIDLRSSPEFLDGHIKDAVHIPLHKILDDEYADILNQDEKINILYHNDHCNACGPWMILKQIGFKNIKILQGGYNYAKPNIIDDYSPMTGNFSDEKAKYDYAKIINETSGSVSINESVTEEVPSKTISVPKENKTEEEGGC